MNVNNNLQGLQQLFSSDPVARAENAGGGSAGVAEVGGGSDQATLSSAASAAAQTAPDADVRMDKVAQVQQAVAAGTYQVPSSAVAEKMIGQMLRE
ncbi:MAG: flagellar biosynthesis anti-sigma factor FlgM [Acidobacteriaceae bacterium]